MIEKIPAVFADSTRTYFDLTRLHQMSQWWHWMAFLAVCLAVVFFVSFLYKRDSVELPKGIRYLLLMLRIVAFGGLLIFFLNLEKRTEKKQVKTSRVAMLLDTSESMNLKDKDPVTGELRTRHEKLVEWMQQGTILDDLRLKHDVSVFRFDESNGPSLIASLPKVVGEENVENDQPAATGNSFDEAKSLYRTAMAIGFLALGSVIMHLLIGKAARGEEGEAWFLLAASVLIIAAIVIAAVCNLRNPDIGPLYALGISEQATVVDEPPKEEASESTSDDIQPTAISIDWQNELDAKGAETRLGEAVRSLVGQERGGPIAGVIVVSDGGSNSGIEYNIAANTAKEANIRIFTVGAGSIDQPKNVRLVDLEAPPRVFPGDKFTVRAYVQSTGITTEESLNVELRSREQVNVKVDLPAALQAQIDSRFAAIRNSKVNSDRPKQVAALRKDFPGEDEQTYIDSLVEKESAGIKEDDATIKIGPKGQIQPVDFQVSPDAVGKRVFTVSVQGVKDELDLEDNRLSATIEIIERKNRVLLFAGGPMREYRFLRNQLFRDKETELRVLLQTASASIAQEADEILVGFPETANELFEYDCLVAFDPDWQQLSSDQTQLIERWVAEKAGGMIAIAGPVFTSKWSRNSRTNSKLNPIRSLYPVSFFGRLSAAIELGNSGSDQPAQLLFSDEAARADFLHIAEDQEAPMAVWDEFEGVYGHAAVKDAKPGATVYARFADSESTSDSDRPIYLAGQFYGAGRVVYLGSGEMWRLNALDSGYFEKFYTKLIRYVSQGRLLRDSSRGVLILDKQRVSRGENVAVRAALTDLQFQPLKAESVEAQLVLPNGNTQKLTLRPIQQSSREGLFGGQFTTLFEGDYRVELLVPDSDDEILTQECRVTIPRLEIENPRRNDPLLSDLANSTGGKYFVGFDSTTAEVSLASEIPAMDQETYLPGVSDDEFQQRLMGWLLAVTCFALCCEWLVRRLSKLA